MSKKPGCLALLAVFAVVAACNAITGNDEEPSRSTASSTPPTTRASSPFTGSGPTATPVEEKKPPGEVITVKRVIDGDTFELADGQRVRVLGIDSCEANTYGGAEATRMAESKLTNSGNAPLTMTTEPGVDKDQYGRLLRYVQMDSGEYDFGESMVEYDHTGVYQGKNDASEAYVARLYAADLKFARNPPAGRLCEDPYPPAPSGGVYVGGDDDHNMRDGALTGGYCRKKWWC